MAVLVERATTDLLIGPDWGLNLEICDAVNHNLSLSRDVVKALRKRLSNKNVKVQLLSLTVIEMVMKNCGESMHQMVAEKDVLQDMVKIVKRKGDLAVRDKILALVESWQKAFGGPAAKYPQYSAVYEELRRSGVQFPVQNVADSVPIFTPAAARQTPSVAATYTTSTGNTTRSLPHLASGLPGFTPARLDEVLAVSENSAWSAKDLDGVQRTTEVLNEMLNALDPGEKQAVFDDVIAQLVEQCITNQKIVRQLVNSTSDENMLCRGLTLNDDIQQVLAKHSAIITKALTQAELAPGSPKGLAVYDNEEDEAEDELSHLAHRSSTRSTRLSQKNGPTKNTPPPYAQSTTMPFTSSTAGTPHFDQGRGVHIDGETPAPSSGPAMPSRSRSHDLPDEEESTVNPFANLASIKSSPSNGSLSDTVNDSSSDSSKFAAHQPSYYGKIFNEPDSSAYKASQQVPENVWLSESSSRNQDHTSQAAKSRQTSHYSADSPFDDDMLNPTAAWAPAAKQKTVSNLPPPPILSSERERFFEEKRQMNHSPKVSSLASSSMDKRMQNLSLLDTKQHDGGYANGVALTATKFQSKQVSPPNRQADRLFEDLVDLQSMRANYKNSSVTNTRPKASEAGGM